MASKIYKILKDRILSLEYEPGENLDEQKIAKEFGVSRTPIREALILLEWEKLIQIVPRVGITVERIDFQKLQEVFKCRVMIEGEIGYLAGVNCTESHLVEIEKLIVECKTVIKKQDPKHLFKLDTEFRKVLATAARNYTLAEISDSLYEYTFRVWGLAVSKRNIQAEAEFELAEMEKTYDALKSNDGELVKQVRGNTIKGYVERMLFNFTD